MARVSPVPDQAAAIATAGGEQLVLLADYHAGLERALRFKEGITLPSRAADRRERVLDLVSDAGADRLIVLGDLTHSIGAPGYDEREELAALVAALDVPITVAKGNHDGELDRVVAEDTALADQLTVTGTGGARLGSIGIVHGHTWPARAVLEADVVCMGHEHPCVRLVDEVGGSRNERVWLRGQLDLDVFPQFDTSAQGPTIVVFPAFNELCGGTWINLPDQNFLAPFLPDALTTTATYLLDGTDLGPYDRI